MDLARAVALRLEVEDLGRRLAEFARDEGIIVSNCDIRTSDVRGPDPGTSVIDEPLLNNWGLRARHVLGAHLCEFVEL